MNSSGESLDTESLMESLERSSKKIEERKKRAEEEKKRLEENEELLSLLRKAINEIQGIKNSMITRDEMKGEMNEFFDKFLNEFSHAVEDIKDSETKNAFREFIKRIRDW